MFGMLVTSALRERERERERERQRERERFPEFNNLVLQINLHCFLLTSKVPLSYYCFTCVVAILKHSTSVPLFPYGEHMLSCTHPCYLEYIPLFGLHPVIWCISLSFFFRLPSVVWFYIYMNQTIRVNLRKI